MANKIKVVITDDQQEVRVPTGIRMLLRRACTAVLVQEGFGNPAEVGVRFVDDGEIRALNAMHRGVDSATDVLSFPLGENGAYDVNHDTGALLLGDIVISLPRAAEQARLYGHSLQRELAYLTVHSMLHLLGCGHEAGGLEAVRMREKEEQVMVQLGLPRGHNYIIQE
ncbi:MAG: rRNA maturation RNase YbeY [Oscillospiraceae bacterium]|jgi:probable rRNA maturation factor|nr:rRNA maturation RNase YbeY [Oscillospiraceae bacterium]